MSGNLSWAKVRAARQQLQGMLAAPRGVQVVVSRHCVQATQERLFPVSRHRSRRIHKKLVKRFGGEFRLVSCAWRVGEVLYVHPEIYARMRVEAGLFLDAVAPTEGDGDVGVRRDRWDADAGRVRSEAIGIGRFYGV